MSGKARKKKQKQKARACREGLKQEVKECRESLDKERKLNSVLQRKLKTTHDRLLSFKNKRAAAEVYKTVTLASPTHRHIDPATMNRILTEALQIPPSMVEELQHIGEGTFGVCKTVLLHGTIACAKTLRASENSSNTNVDTKAIILHEAAMLSKIRHPHICFLIGIQTTKEPFQLITVYYSIDGVSISVYDTFCGAQLSENKKHILESVRQCLSLPVWLTIMKDLGGALAFIHDKSIVHRDIKSDNVILYRQDGKIFCVLVDFGKSNYINKVRPYRLTEEEKKKYQCDHKHVAPDVVDGVSNVTTATDMYSYGRLFKNIITYFPLSVSVINAQIRGGIKHCLKFKDNERPSAQYMVELLNSSL